MSKVTAEQQAAWCEIVEKKYADQAVWFLYGFWDEMEAQKTREARIYKALDKLEALIQHNEADIKTWLPLEYSLQRSYGTEECRFDPYISELRAEVLRDSERKIEEK